MTQTTKIVLEQFQVRKTKKQKTAFFTYVQSVAKQNGYSCQIEKAMLGSKNIVVGDPATAKILYTAHYDTCPVLPFPNFITPLHISIYLLYQLALVVGIFGILFGGSFLLGLLLGLLNANFIVTLIISELFYFGLLALLFCGPANKHTTNDNTSGVTTLLDLMSVIPVEDRGTVAFIFFDNEEKGMFGSLSYHSKHKKETNDKLLLNFDCVSDGDHILFAVNKKAAHFVPILNDAFPANHRYSVKILTKGVFYPSDQKSFPCGVGVAALKKSKRFSVEYMNRIHTKRDTVYEEENIAFLVDGCLRLNQLIKNQAKQ